MAYSETLSSLRTKISSLIPDASIANGDIDNAIKACHLLFPGTYLVDHVDESSVVLAASTYEYALPLTNGVSTFVYVHRVTVEGTTAGVFDGGQLDVGSHVSLEYLPSSTWNLRLKKAINDGITAGRKLRIEGMRKYVLPSADGSAIELHNGWVMNYALFLLHQSRGGSSSDLASWHQRMAGVFYQAAKDIEDNIDTRPWPGSVLVPGAL